MRTNTDLIKRTKRTENFTVIGNDILTRKDLSFSAKGFLCYILSLPNDWVVHKSWLQKEFKMGRKQIDNLFSELETAGYLQTIDMVREKGKFMGKNYFFYDNPIKSICSTDVPSPATVQPTTVKEQLQRTNTNQELTQQNKHTQCESDFLKTTIDRDAIIVARRLKKINGGVSERFKKFSDLVYKQAEKDKIDSEIAEQLIDKYGADDKDYEGYMRFETERYFDLQLMLRAFNRQQEKHDSRY